MISSLSNALQSTVQCFKKHYPEILAPAASLVSALGVARIHVNDLHRLSTDSTQYMGNGTCSLRPDKCVHIDFEAISKSPCKLEEFIAQGNRQQGDSITVLDVKKHIVKEIVYYDQFLCEILIWRGLIQEGLFTRLPKAAIREISPGSETIIDSTPAKVARVALITLLQLSLMPNSLSTRTALFCINSLALGVLKERLSLLPSFAAPTVLRILHELVAWSPILLSC